MSPTTHHSPTTRRVRAVVALAAGLLTLGVVAGCSDDDSAADGASTTSADASPSSPSTNNGAGNNGENASDQEFPDVVKVKASADGDTWDFDVTMSSPYDSPERYADGWRITGPDGTVFGEHSLGHDHASEQPFTRSQTGVKIPDDVDRVVVEGRDQANGYGGKTQTVDLAAAR